MFNIRPVFITEFNEFFVRVSEPCQTILACHKLTIPHSHRSREVIFICSTKLKCFFY